MKNNSLNGSKILKALSIASIAGLMLYSGSDAVFADSLPVDTPIKLDNSKALKGNSLNYQTIVRSDLIDGALLYNTQSDVGDILGGMSHNYVESTNLLIYGGLIYNSPRSKNGSISIGDISGGISNNHIKARNGIDGGLIYNKAYSQNSSAKVGDISGGIKDNIIETTLSTASIRGGLLSNYSNGYSTVVQMGNIYGDISGNQIIPNSAYIQGGLIYNVASGTNSSVTMGNIEGGLLNNTVSTQLDVQGGLIYNHGRSTMGSIAGRISGNNVMSANNYVSGGLILNGNSTIGDLHSGITSNNVSAGTYVIGGLINNSGNIGSVEESISSNCISAGTYINGGLIKNSGLVGTLNDVSYNNVTADSYIVGGAINNSNSIVGITGGMEYNQVVASDYINGGLIYNVPVISSGDPGVRKSPSLRSSSSDTASRKYSIGYISGGIKNNIVSSSSYINGGLIYNAGQNYFDIGGGTFEEEEYEERDVLDELLPGTGTLIPSGGNTQTQSGMIIGKITEGILNNEVSASGNINGGLIYNAKSKIEGIYGGIHNNTVTSKANIKGGLIYNSLNGEDAIYMNSGLSVDPKNASITIDGGIYENSISAINADGWLLNNGGYIEWNNAYSIDNTFNGDKGSMIYNDNLLDINSAEGGSVLIANNTSTADGATIYNYGESMYNNFLSLKTKEGTTEQDFFNHVGISSWDELVNIENDKTKNDFLMDCKIFVDYDELANRFGFKSMDDLIADWKENGFNMDGTGSKIDFIDNTRGNEFERFPGQILPEEPGENVLIEYTPEGFARMIGYTKYSSYDEYAQEQGYESFEEMMEDFGLHLYSSTEEMLEAQGYYDTIGIINISSENAVLTNNVHSGEYNDIYNDGIINLKENSKLTTTGTVKGAKGMGKMNLESGSVWNSANDIQGQKLTLDDATLNLGAFNQANGTKTYGTMNLNGLAVTSAGGNINAINNHVYDHQVGAVTLNGVLNYTSDVDLENAKMDSLTATSFEGNGTVKVNGFNILTDTERMRTEVYFTNLLKDNVENNVFEVGSGVANGYQSTAYSPIYKYNVGYENRDDAGYFVFTRGTGSDSFNPSVLVSPVTAQAAAQSTLNQTFNYVFEHADTFSALPNMERMSKINSNTFALSTDYNKNLGPIDLEQKNKAIWVRPYSAFENLPLKHGPKVDVISYGTFVGFDSDIHKLKRGWANVGTAYIGYNGSQMKYGNVDSTMNGGLLGLTETFYKGNFFTALTATAGAGVVDTSTMYGHEDNTFLMGGIASKTGYNFEFKSGKFIIQPIMFMSYSIVKGLDYTNAAGVRVNNEPAHTVELNPSVRFIGNFEGWQPYASVGMVWDILHESNTKVNGVKLPEMYTKPYVQYGVGLQRCWDEKFSAFGQAMIRNGGRNGISLTFGLRWALGKDAQTVKNTTPKTVKATTSRIAQQQPTGKKVLKQLSPTQKAHIQNTTRTSMNAIIR